MVIIDNKTPTMLRCRMTNAKRLAVRGSCLYAVNHMYTLTVMSDISKFCIPDSVVLLHCNFHLITSSQSSLSK